MTRRYLLASDFDQTLSFNDSGVVLSELIGLSGFRERIAGLARTNLIQQGGELAYLLRHDPEYRGVRREHLEEVGRRIRLKQNILLLARLLQQGVLGHRFDFYVISAAPEEVIQAALEGIVPAEHIHGTRFRYAPSGEVESIARVPASAPGTRWCRAARAACRARARPSTIALRACPTSPRWASTSCT